LYFNDVSAGAIFGSEMTEGTIFDKEATEITIPATSKLALAHTLLDMALGKLKLDHG